MVSDIVGSILELKHDNNSSIAIWLWIENNSDPVVLDLLQLHTVYSEYELSLSTYHTQLKEVANIGAKQYVSIEAKKRSRLSKLRMLFNI